MERNILNSRNVSSAYLIYMDGPLKKRISVKVSYSGEKECYLVGPLPPNYSKIKRKTPATVIAYTMDGVYTCEGRIMDSNISQNELVYNVELPNGWKYSQMRMSTRKEVKLPIKITFNDGFEIKGESYDMSLGGVAFLVEEPVSSLYQKVNGVLTLKLPANQLVNFSNGQLETGVKFVRERKLPVIDGGKICYVYRFLSLNHDDSNVLKSFLAGLN